MDNHRVARELVKAARELVGALKKEKVYDGWLKHSLDTLGDDRGRRKIDRLPFYRGALGLLAKRMKENGEDQRLISDVERLAKRSKSISDDLQKKKEDLDREVDAAADEFAGYTVHIRKNLEKAGLL